MRISDWSSDVCSSDLVSMPCWELFDAQDAAYRRDILPSDVLTVSIEAGSTFGWESYTGLDGLRFGIDRYGASAPAEALYEYFGLKAEGIAPEVGAALLIRRRNEKMEGKLQSTASGAF